MKNLKRPFLELKRLEKKSERIMNEVRESLKKCSNDVSVQSINESDESYYMTRISIPEYSHVSKKVKRWNEYSV